MQHTITDRAVMTSKAKDCLRSVEGCPTATCEDLGRARDYLNRVSHGYDPDTALINLTTLEAEVWHGNPPHRTA